MAGLYIHIPFCRQKCHYCNFFSLATRKYHDQVYQALKDEMHLRRNYMDEEKLDTIYFGGGTPSLYAPQKLQEIIETAEKLFGLNPDPEITVEANPDDITEEWLDNLKATKMNRLSIGLQSLHDNDLEYLNRAHSGKEAKNAVELARDYGFENLSIDFIYGFPTLSDEKWLANLQWAVAHKVPHISAYALTVEPGTALDLFIRKGKYRPVSDEAAERHFMLMSDFLGEHGYEHYEISNLALPGKYARHNTAYWSGEKYLGIGPSSHSFDGISRQWNIASIKGYLEGIQNGKPDFEREVLDPVQHLNEYIMTSLRTMWGMDMAKMERDFDKKMAAKIIASLENYRKSDLLTCADGKVFLTPKGKLFADRIASDLFVEED